MKRMYSVMNPIGWELWRKSSVAVYKILNHNNAVNIDPEIVNR